MKSYDYVMQDNNFDCGLASLITCFYNLGFKVPKEEVKKHLKIKDQGIKAYDLVRVSKELGITAKGVRGEVINLNKKDLPCIAHVVKDKSYYHYIVILEIDKIKKILKVFDPAKGIEEISFFEYEDIATQIYIVFDKKKIPKFKDSRFRKYLYDLFLENKRMILKCLLISLIFIVFSILSNYYIQILLTFLNDDNLLFIVLILLLFLSINISKNMVDFYKSKLLLKLNLKIDRKINKKVIRHIVLLPYQYFSTKATGELVSIINDVENFKDIIVKLFVIGCVDLILVILIIFYLTIYNIVYLPFLLFLVLVILIVAYRYRSIYNDKFIKFKQSKISFSTKLIEAIEAFYTIKGLHLENKLTDMLNKSYNNVLKNNEDYLFKSNVYSFIISNLGDVFYLLVIFIGVLLIIYKGFYFLNIVLFSNLFYLLIGFINNIADSLVMYKIYQSSIVKVLDILDVKKEEFKNTKLNSFEKIAFFNTSLVVDDKKILDNVCLEINKGRHLFIYGKSGSGKSTLIKLLLKYYLPTDGKILIDDINYDVFDLKVLRKNITYVSQNEYLFTDTIYKNLQLVNDGKKKIKKAINTCLINETFMNNGIDGTYLLTDNGINLSGGERKKILIARGLLQAKNILVLDETFNEIDIETERRILQNILNNYKNLTVILISHRYNNSDLFCETFKLEREV